MKYDPIVERIDTTNTKKQPNTYVRALEIHTEYTGKSPEELITEAKKEIKAGNTN